MWWQNIKVQKPSMKIKHALRNVNVREVQRQEKNSTKAMEKAKRTFDDYARLRTKEKLLYKIANVRERLRIWVNDETCMFECEVFHYL